MSTEKIVPVIEVSDELLTVQIYQTLDETLEDTSYVNLLKSYTKLMWKANQKALTLFTPKDKAYKHVTCL
jgi:hypothetical protein